MNGRLFFVAGSILAGTAVAAGAFGAHGLQDRISPELLDTFNTAARYQMYHGLALLAVALAVTHWPNAKLATSGWLFIAGTAVFSGSLYLLVLSGARWLGAVTPVGGLLLLGGWTFLAIQSARTG